MMLSLLLVLAACGDETSENNTSNNADNNANNANNAENNTNNANNAENNTNNENNTENNTNNPDNNTNNTNNPDNNTNNENNNTPVCPEELGERPDPRAEMMGIYDPRERCIVYFGGDDGVPQQCSPAPHPIGGLWVYDTTCQTFTEITYEEGPGPRTRGTAVYDAQEHRMILFGGRYREGSSGRYTLYNEVWALDLTTYAWELLHDGRGEAPAKRSTTSSIYNPAMHEVVLFGGNLSDNGLNFTPENDLWVFNLDTNLWRELSPQGSKPASRLFHSSAFDADNQTMYVYGGGDANAFVGPFFGDLWAFNLQTERWSLLSEGDEEVAPARRIWSTLAAHGGKVYLFGGHDDGALGNQNDTWSFDPASGEWTELIAPEQIENEPNGFCDFPADFTAPNLDAPDRREAHLAVIDPDRGEWFVYGGKTDCGIIDDVWTFDLNRESWVQSLPATIGEACIRGENPDQCSALCR
jgi:hypothetical protein